MRTTRLIPALAAAGFVLTTGTLAPAVAAPSPGLSPALSPVAAGWRPDVPLEDLVTTEGVWRHLEAFQSAADAHDGNRAMGTPGYEASAEYIEATLTAAGYTPQRQYFDVEKFVVLDLAVEVPNVALAPVPMTYSPSTPDDGVVAGLIQPAIVDGCPADAETGHADSWAGVDATGKIALVRRGACSFALKSRAAAAAGAEAVIVYNNTAGSLNGTLGGPGTDFAPAVGVTQAEGQSILAALAADPTLTVSFDLQTVLEHHRTFNVIAETRTGHMDNVVMLGAHLDSVEEGPGINDNGTGSAGILEVAVQLAKVHPVENRVRFAWWGAEELNLLGSTHYVNNLSDAKKDQIALYMNFDMIGSPNYTIGVYDADQSTFTAPVTVPPGSAAVEDVFTDYFDSVDQPWVDSPFSGRSDYQAFINNGIPASGLFTGADGIKTDAEVALFGGTAGIPLDPAYHSPGDTIDNVDATALTIMSKAIAHATEELAFDTSAVNDGS
ncbi:M28 family metallopeptidase [Antribacter gilvus]|uniref:M28 family metallopeptidase n=1 Tax=Antribacter gilvus TaxID=2304675 RepID=UPI000F7A3FA0|nr:M28 family metallopeptidase [Antribacter gilvus]